MFNLDVSTSKARWELGGLVEQHEPFFILKKKKKTGNSSLQPTKVPYNHLNNISIFLSNIFTTSNFLILYFQNVLIVFRIR